MNKNSMLYRQLAYKRLLRHQAPLEEVLKQRKKGRLSLEEMTNREILLAMIEERKAKNGYVPKPKRRLRDRIFRRGE